MQWKAKGAQVHEKDKALLINRFLKARLIGPFSALCLFFIKSGMEGSGTSASRPTLKALFTLKASLRAPRGRKGRKHPKINTWQCSHNTGESGPRFRPAPAAARVAAACGALELDNDFTIFSHSALYPWPPLASQSKSPSSALGMRTVWDVPPNRFGRDRQA